MRFPNKTNIATSVRTAKNALKRATPTGLIHFWEGLRKLSNTRRYRQEIANLRNELMYFKVLHHFEFNAPDEYISELAFLKKAGALTPFPYPRTNLQPALCSPGFDRAKGLPFVFHKDKRLYFPKEFGIEQARDLYLNLIVNENILEGRHREKTPHQYTSESFHVKKGDILVDVGACEGLFMLNEIENIRKGVLFESDKRWIDALTATFEPYRERVTIIHKLVSNRVSATETTLDGCLEGMHGDIFIKMDVEGSERLVLEGAKSVLERDGDVRVACCTYHNQDDADTFEQFFKERKFNTEFSDGYILFYHDPNSRPPYFRKGLIRARRIIA